MAPWISRGVSDVWADADPNSGSYVCWDDPSGGTACTTGSDGLTQGYGTSLATQLWAGMMADINQYLRASGPPAGFVTPTLYAIGGSSSYPTAFHDIDTAPEASNGDYATRRGWDEVTGLGSSDAWGLATVLNTRASNSALYAPVGQPGLWHPGDSASYKITLTNNGSATWPSAAGPTQVQLGIHFGCQGGGYPISQQVSQQQVGWQTDQRVPLPHDVAPGGTVTIDPLTVSAPSTLGCGTLPYVLEYELVQGGTSWFDQFLDSTVQVAYTRRLVAFPNSITDADGSQTGTVGATLIPSSSNTAAISWDTADGSMGYVYVSSPGFPAALVAAGPHGSTVASWISPGAVYTFTLHATQDPNSPALVPALIVAQETTLRLAASPDPVPAPGQGPGSSVITWDTGTPYSGVVCVSTDGGQTVTEFASGASGSASAPSIYPQAVYDFYLFLTTQCPPSSLGWRAHVGVNIGTPGPTIDAVPNPVTGSSTTTTIGFNTPDGQTGQVWVSVNGGQDVLFAQASSAQISAPWINPGNSYTFKLYEGTTHHPSKLVGTVTVIHS